MRAFLAIGGDEGKLPGRMPRPARLHDNTEFDNAQCRIVVHGLDHATDLSALADSPEQGQHRRDRTTRNQSSQQPSNRFSPIVKFGQYNRVVNENKIAGRQPFVGLLEQAIGKVLDERQNQQNQREIKRPFGY